MHKNLHSYTAPVIQSQSLNTAVKVRISRSLGSVPVDAQSFHTTCANGREAQIRHWVHRLQPVVFLILQTKQYNCSNSVPCACRTSGKSRQQWHWHQLLESTAAANSQSPWRCRSASSVTDDLTAVQMDVLHLAFALCIQQPSVSFCYVTDTTIISGALSFWWHKLLKCMAY